MQKFKRLIPLFCLVAALLGGCGAVSSSASLLGLTGESPYYHLGDTTWDHGGIEEYYFNQIPSALNEIYRELYARISAGEDQASLFAQVDVEDFWTAYYAVMADHPEFFWVGTNIEAQQSGLTGKVVGYTLSITVDPAQRENMRAQLESTADAIIASIPEGYSDYGKMKTVYEYLINHVDYQADSVDNQNIQSALLWNASVCAGYSRAFQYVLHRMGMFCTYVTGTITGGGDHAWNIVRIGDLYYNVDVTWGDPVFVGIEEGAQASDIMNYNYLCVTDAELSATHTSDVRVPLPSCTDDSYNYYKLNGMYYETFDRTAIYDALMNSVWNGDANIAMKFGSREAFDTAKYEIFSNGLIQDAAQYLMKSYGMTTWNYSYHTDEEFNLITIDWDR